MERTKKIVVISGATATGKSALAFALARETGFGIVSADSMQVYRHMDIASAKPTREQRRIVPHAGIDIAEPTESFSVSRWLSATERLFSDDSHKWMLVGGSGLYIQAFLHGLDKLPESPPELRKKWEEVGLEKAVRELKSRDPGLASKVDLTNLRRVVRALVLLEMGVKPQGKSFSQPSRDTLHIHLVRDATSLYKRIAERTQKMFDTGLVEEFKVLVDLGLRPNHTAWQAIGMNYLQALCQGRLSLTDAKNAITRRTWQFSKRQRTWFRKRDGMHTIVVEENWGEEEIFIATLKLIKQYSLA